MPMIFVHIELDCNIVSGIGLQQGRIMIMDDVIIKKRVLKKNDSNVFLEVMVCMIVFGCVCFQSRI